LLFALPDEDRLCSKSFLLNFLGSKDSSVPVLLHFSSVSYWFSSTCWSDDWMCTYSTLNRKTTVTFSQTIVTLI